MAAEGIAATTAMVMATAMMTTGEDDDNNGQGRQGQWVRTVTKTGVDNNDGKEDNSKNDGNDGKGDWQGW